MYTLEHLGPAPKGTRIPPFENHEFTTCHEIYVSLDVPPSLGDGGLLLIWIALKPLPRPAKPIRDLLASSVKPQTSCTWVLYIRNSLTHLARRLTSLIAVRRTTARCFCCNEDPLWPTAFINAKALKDRMYASEMESRHRLLKIPSMACLLSKLAGAGVEVVHLADVNS